MATTASMPAAKPTKVADLKPHPRNYRSHPEGQLSHIEASIRQHGFYRNIVAARDGTILAGHGVVEASRRMGLTKVPVIFLDLDSDSPAALKILAADNEIAKLAEDDGAVLAAILREIGEVDIGDLLGTGYDQATLDALLKSSKVAGAATGGGAGPTPPEEFPEFDEKIETKHQCPKCGYAFSGGKVVEAYVTPAEGAGAT